MSLSKQNVLKFYFHSFHPFVFAGYSHCCDDDVISLTIVDDIRVHVHRNEMLARFIIDAYPFEPSTPRTPKTPRRNMTRSRSSKDLRSRSAEEIKRKTEAGLNNRQRSVDAARSKTNRIRLHVRCSVQRSVPPFVCIEFSNTPCCFSSVNAGLNRQLISALKRARKHGRFQ